jgi:CMP-N-acetylneuraminic acid synthetase
MDVIHHALLEAEKRHEKRYETVVDLDVTAPLRSTDDIEGAYQKLIQEGYDAVVSGCEARRNPYFNLVELDGEGRAFVSKKREGTIQSRQEAPKVYELNCSIYVYRRSFLDLSPTSCIGSNTGLYLMPTERSWDIDHEEDFQILETLMQRRNRR